MDKRLEQTLHKKDTFKWAIKRSSISLVIREKPIKTTMHCSFTIAEIQDTKISSIGNVTKIEFY